MRWETPGSQLIDSESTPHDDVLPYVNFLLFLNWRDFNFYLSDLKDYSVQNTCCVSYMGLITFY
uniref:Uncharacterized protein n=1 Tax=Sander lucioperca TaxID=283035 RepID=A0A8C9XUK1_SANLU